MLTQERLKQLFRYTPKTGRFTRLCSQPSVNAGDVAGCLQRGYVKIGIDGKVYNAHRLAWLYVNGEFPENQIDHVNGVRDDNRICNLRDVTNIENHKNQKTPVNNTSGVIGVSWIKGSKKWRSKIGKEFMQIRLGEFTDKFEAICARKSAENKYEYHANHGR